MAGGRSGQDYGKSSLYSIHIGNLPLDTNRAELERLFSGCGQVEDSDLPSATVSTEKERGFKFGFIRYKDLETCQYAISEMNNWVLRGRRIHVDLAKQTRERVSASERIKTEALDQPSLEAKANSSYHGASSADDLQNLWRVKDTCNFINQEICKDPGVKKQLDIERVLERIFRETGERVPANVELTCPVKCTLDDLKQHLRKSTSCKKDDNCSSDEHLQVFMESLKDILNTVSEFIVDTSQEISDSGNSSAEERSPQRERPSKTEYIHSEAHNVSFEKKEQEASEFSYNPIPNLNLNKSITMNTTSNNNCESQSSNTNPVISDILEHPATSNLFGDQSVSEICIMSSEMESPKRMTDMLEMMRKSSPESCMNKARLEKLMSTLSMDTISDQSKYHYKVPDTETYLERNNLPKSKPINPSVHEHSRTKSMPIPFKNCGRIVDSFSHGRDDSPTVMEEQKVGGQQPINNYFPGFGRGRGRGQLNITG